MLVLVVDDDPVTNEMIALGVQSIDATVTVLQARTGLEAWHILLSQDVDVLLTDLLMPDMGGETLCKKVRGELPHYVYTICVSAFGGSDLIRQTLEAGADDFLRKPYELEHLSLRLLVATRIASTLRDYRSHVTGT